MTMTDTKTVYYTDHNLHASSAIIESWHDANNNLLFVQFPSGQIAGYENFDENEYSDFVNASSVGRYYSQWIKNHYRGVNTEGVEFVPAAEKVEPYVEIKTPEPQKQTFFTVHLLNPYTARYAATSPQEAAEFAAKDYPHAEVVSVEWKP